MKQFFLLFTVALLQTGLMLAQSQLPVGFAADECDLPIDYYRTSRSPLGNTTPPSFPVRTMAEWEEIQALVITWKNYPTTLTEIVRHAREECEVIIICDDSILVQNSLTSAGVDLAGLSYIEAPSNSIWMRDYGANTVYMNDVDSVLLVDWIYNRPRPDDDVAPEAIANFKGLTLFSTTTAPNDLVHTGGNFMSDGFGTAFSSELVLEENVLGNPYGVSPKTSDDIDSIMMYYMGIDRYIKMPVLPYDGIHHIDMHMKLLDEETLVVGEYPQGVADGPQIEANLQYVLSNFNSVFGTPYKVVRTEMPPGSNGNYPDAQPWWQAGEYRTYANSVFVNKTLLVPIYVEEYDTVALKILREELPGYKVVGINCNSIIQAGGALHCITRAIGVNDPLLISHQELTDRVDDTNNYTVDATIKHRSGIAGATLFYRTDTNQLYQILPMSLSNPIEDIWSATIPNNPTDATLHYYISAIANSGKEQVRPMPAPVGYWNFDIRYSATAMVPVFNETNKLTKVFPSPAAAVTCVQLEVETESDGELAIYDVLGQKVTDIHQGTFKRDQPYYFFDASRLESGTYFVRWATTYGNQTKKVIVR